MLWFILKPFSKSESIGDAHEFSKHSKYHGGSIPFQCHTQWTGSTCHWPPSNIWGLKLKHVVAAKGKNKQMCKICGWSAIERLWHTRPQRQHQKQKCLRLEKKNWKTLAACLCSPCRGDACWRDARQRLGVARRRRGGLGLHKARHTNSHNHSAKECLITLIFRKFPKFASKPSLFLPEKLSKISVQETCCTNSHLDSDCSENIYLSKYFIKIKPSLLHLVKVRMWLWASNSNSYNGPQEEEFTMPNGRLIHGNALVHIKTI